MPEILMVCDRSEEAGPVLEYELAEAFKKKGETADITTSLNEENAKKHLPGNVSLVITFLQIPKQPLTKASPEEQEGLELLCWMNHEHISTPSILITPTYTKKLQGAQTDLGDCYVVLSGKDMVQEVVKQALTMVKEPPERCLEVEIDVNSQTEWGYRLIPKGFSFDDRPGRLAIDEQTIKHLLNDSQSLGSAENWQDILKQIGDDLLQVLSKDRKFLLRLWDGLSMAGGETHTRVRFLVKPELHRLALEAVLCPRRSEEFWMLSAPVYRRLWTADSVTGGNLFEGGQRIDCLIIDAPTEGLVNDTLLKPCYSVSAECDWLEDFLSRKGNGFNIGEVLHLRANNPDHPLAEQVQSNLERDDRKWTVVHYAGHSYYDARTGQGFVFFPGPGGKGVEKMELNRFSDCLRNATFVYLSSCDSSAGPFVFELANRRVNNILGFRWKIDDEFAREYAENFYQELFESRSLEKAFLKARKQMHKLHTTDPIWAAPILVKQLSDS
jgi:hypothetical protein